MSSDDIAYYRERAKVERERAAHSSRAGITEIREELASLYDALIEHQSFRPTLSIKFRTAA